MNKNYFTKLLSSFVVAPVVAIIMVLVAAFVLIVGALSLVLIPLAGIFGKIEYKVTDSSGKTKWVKIGNTSIGETIRR